MPNLTELIKGRSGHPPLLLDAWDYAAKVLDRAAPPWSDTAAFVSLARRAGGLLRPDILMLPLLSWFGAQLAARPELCAAMGTRSRTAFALKTALSDKALRQAFSELVGALTSALAQVPIVPVLAAPERWLLAAYIAAHGASPDDIDDDMCEQAEVFLADFLREIGSQPIGGLLLDEPEAVADEAWNGMHTPVFNACVHYRWSLGAVLSSQSPAAPSPIEWTLGSRDAALPRGEVIEPEFWGADGTRPAPAALYAARIPQDSEPEVVLRRLTELRASAQQ